VRVLPQEANVDLEKLAESIKAALGGESTIRAKSTEPIAFGLSALILDIVTPEEEGRVDAVENAISSAPLVGQYELMGVSRMSGHVPKPQS
jgi:elongation factor 1-beta